MPRWIALTLFLGVMLGFGYLRLGPSPWVAVGAIAITLWVAFVLVVSGRIGPRIKTSTRVTALVATAVFWGILATIDVVVTGEFWPKGALGLGIVALLGVAAVATRRELVPAE